MAPDPGETKTYTHYQRGDITVGPDTMRVAAEMYEKSWSPIQIAIELRMPLAAVHDIIATYEFRAERFFKAVRGGAS
jgi:hypothetical protein